jgi:hypothetical protein
MPANSRLFCSLRGNTFGLGTGWLGWEDSNPHMADGATILLRIDWLPWTIGALLWGLGAAEAASGSALPANLPGGAEVVWRIAPRQPQRVP